MDINNIEQLKKLSKVFNTDNVITSAEIEQVLAGILTIMSSFKKDNENLTKEATQVVNDLLDKVISESDNLKKETSITLDSQSKKIMSDVEDKLLEVKRLIKEAKATKPKNGKDANEPRIIKSVLDQIKLPEYKPTLLDTPKEIKDKLETLNGDDRLDISAIKGIDKLATQANLERGISILDQRTQFLINKTSTSGTSSPLTTKGDVYTYSTTNDRLPVGANGTVLTADSSTATGLKWAAVTGTGTVTDVSVTSANGFAGSVATSTTTPAITISTTVTGLLKGNGTAVSAAVANTDYQSPITLTTTGTSGAATFNGTTLNIPNYTSGDGTPGGSDTQLQYNNAGAFEGISGATTDGTVTTFTTNNLKAADVTASGSGGLVLKNSAGTSIISLGSGGGTNATMAAPTNIGSNSADYIQIAGGTNNTTQTATGSSTDIDITLIPKGAGKAKITGNLNISGLTASQLVATNASKDLLSLDTATYPSLTEISYVKGVTSAIQTQLNAKGSGTVTSVSFTGGLISVATATTTPALTVAGISGGIPYFSSTSTWASSALLAANAIMIGGGAGAAPATTATGTGVLTALGINVGSAGAFVTFNGALGTPTSGTLTNCTGLPISTGVSGLGTGVATFLATPSSANLASAMTDETGSGSLVFATSPTLVTPILGTPTSGTLTNCTGLPVSGITSSTSTALGVGSLELGNASDTTLARVAAGIISVEGEVMNGYATTATAAGTTTLTITSAKTQYFTGTSTQTVKLPTTSVILGQSYTISNQSTGNVTVQSSGANTIQILGAGMTATFVANTATPTTAAHWNYSMIEYVGLNNPITASSNAATINLAYKTNTVTNNSAATLTITLPTAGAVDGEMRVVRVLDFSAVAQTITWVNTENSTVTAPTTSNGSTTLPLTIGFQYNNGTSKWRCIASC